LVIWSVDSTQLKSYRTISVNILQQWLQYDQTITTLASFSQPSFFLCEGGAERLIVDAACQLAAHGHDVHVFTSHHDKNRCFEETVSGKPLNFTHYADTLFL
jgi:hypothetical protein